MRAVNLLPREYVAERKRPPLPVLVACVGAALAAAVVAAGYLSASSHVGAERGRLADAQARLAALPQPPGTPATLAAIPRERQARVAALSSALGRRVAWDRILREVSLVLPDDVWLSELDAAASADDGVSLTGFTYSQAGVARLLARLQVVPDLEQVALASSAQTTVGKRKLVTFTIDAAVRGAGAAS